MRKGHQDERGAAAVEFALVAPVLLLMVLGIAEFGQAYHVQATISQAAREGVRVMAVKNNPAGCNSRNQDGRTDAHLDEHHRHSEQLHGQRYDTRGHGHGDGDVSLAFYLQALRFWRGR